jgi:hypothetical protein
MKPRRAELRNLALRAGRLPGSRGLRSLGWLAVLALAVAITLPAASAASALITGSQVKDGSVTGRDVRDHSLPGIEFGHLVAGPQGDPGLQGLPGDPGPQGPAGSSGYETALSGGVDVTKTSTAQVDCPAGKVAVGGGVGSSVPLNAEVLESAPLDTSGSGWLATVHNRNAPEPLTIFVWAICVTP